MHLWSLHPSLLDAKGLVALWREGLLAQHVLQGKTKGYRAHPQLHRFQAHKTPIIAIATYLHEVAAEATRRGYAFDASKIVRRKKKLRIRVTEGQVAFEYAHLVKKLRRRDPKWLRTIKGKKPGIHPLFALKPGGIEDWERGNARPKAKRK
jgi:Pyrimidine dimer DNA glycosylase